MRSGKFLVVGSRYCCWSPRSRWPTRPWSRAATRPWHISKVARLSTARDGAAAAAEAAPQKYLHIEVQFNTPADAQKKHKFRVVNERGDEVGDLWGWNDGRSLVIFEGKWEASPVCTSTATAIANRSSARSPRLPVVHPVVTYTPPVVRQPQRLCCAATGDVVVRDREYVDDRRLIVEPRDQESSIGAILWSSWTV